MPRADAEPKWPKLEVTRRARFRLWDLRMLALEAVRFSGLEFNVGVLDFNAFGLGFEEPKDKTQCDKGTALILPSLSYYCRGTHFSTARLYVLYVHHAAYLQRLPSSYSA